MCPVDYGVIRKFKLLTDSVLVSEDYGGIVLSRCMLFYRLTLYGLQVH